jgi:hypothetical protein
VVRYRTYEVLKAEAANPRLRWAYLPYSMHMAGPREAIQHMIIRKNYGEGPAHMGAAGGGVQCCRERSCRAEACKAAAAATQSSTAVGGAASCAAVLNCSRALTITELKLMQQCALQGVVHLVPGYVKLGTSQHCPLH